MYVGLHVSDESVGWCCFCCSVAGLVGGSLGYSVQICLSELSVVSLNGLFVHT